MRRSHRGVLAALVLVVAFAGACGDDDSSSVSTDTTPSDTGSSGGTTVPTQPCDFQGSAETVEGAQEGGTLFLTAVRAARQPCFDRVVLEFQQDGTPGYTVGYQDGPILEDASGEPVDVPGSAFLVIKVTPASGFNFDTSTPSYNGPDRVEPSDTEHVEAVVRSGDFEAVLTWAVGIDEQRPFAVSTLSGPTRLVVDIG
jgi:hypothetical protein